MKFIKKSINLYYRGCCFQLTHWWWKTKVLHSKYHGCSWKKLRRFWWILWSRLRPESSGLQLSAITNQDFEVPRPFIRRLVPYKIRKNVHSNLILHHSSSCVQWFWVSDYFRPQMVIRQNELKFAWVSLGRI